MSSIRIGPATDPFSYFWRKRRRGRWGQRVRPTCWPISEDERHWREGGKVSRLIWKGSQVYYAGTLEGTTDDRPLEAHHRKILMDVNMEKGDLKDRRTTKKKRRVLDSMISSSTLGGIRVLDYTKTQNVCLTDLLRVAGENTWKCFVVFFVHGASFVICVSP